MQGVGFALPHLLKGGVFAFFCENGGIGWLYINATCLKAAGASPCPTLSLRGFIKPAPYSAAAFANAQYDKKQIVGFGAYYPIITNLQAYV